jgi:hypothetical protein
MRGLPYELFFEIALFSKARDVCALSELCTNTAPLCDDEFLFSKLLWRDFQLVGGKELYVLLRRFIVSLKRKQNNFSYSVFMTSSDFNNICGYKLDGIPFFVNGKVRSVHPYKRAILSTINLMSSWKTVRVDDIGCRYPVIERGPLFGKIIFIDSGLCMWKDKQYVVILTMERIVKYASKKINS